MPGEVALAFSKLLIGELEKIGVKVAGVGAEPVVSGVRRYWLEQNPAPNQSELVSRAQGCLLGQLAGDALGSLVEFKDAAEIKDAYPDGVRDLVAGGTWNTLAGQPTDDSEMALLLARHLVAEGKYDQQSMVMAYRFWLDSEPFDRGGTITAALQGEPNPDSQANGAMMRISPLGIFGANLDLRDVARLARLDAAITHPNPLCLEANQLFAMAIAQAVKTGASAQELYWQIADWAEDLAVDSSLMLAVRKAAAQPPADYLTHQGWVLIALQNALWQLLHAPSLEEAVIDTVMRGGDTDTNAAICGALLGAIHGREAIPTRWVESILTCRPQKGMPAVFNPRPECFWPVDALELAEQLTVPRQTSEK